MNLPQTNYSFRNLTIEEEYSITGTLAPDSILLLLEEVDSLKATLAALPE